MKLYITNPSPFARKCRIVARELGLSDRVAEIVADPYANDPHLLSANPIVQVPTLIAEDGRPITDSALICEYLNEIVGGLLLPPSGPDRLRVRRLEVLAGGALEMGVKLALEKRRPEHERSPSWIGRWTENLNRTLDRLEAEGVAPEPLDLGVITTGVLVTWLGFRHPDLNWSAGRPNLRRLQDALEARPSFAETRPDL